MTKPIGYFADYSLHPAIATFSEQFENGNGECTLSDNDQAALVAVLAQHAWGLISGLEDRFWMNVEDSIGDGVETSMENEEDTDPMYVALKTLETIDSPELCYGLIAWLVQ